MWNSEKAYEDGIKQVVDWQKTQFLLIYFVTLDIRLE